MTTTTMMMMTDEIKGFKSVEVLSLLVMFACYYCLIHDAR